MGTVWTAAVILAAGSALVALAVSDAAVEILLGLLAPLAVTLGSWRMMERAYRRSPEQLARLMVRAFVGKLVLFGIYVTLAVGVLALDAAWFIGSFAISFVVLHLAEAVELQRLFTG
ncbi:MAG: hypothetical protein J4G16_01115 [Acidobacteria bacterium]|nr:hypothetical protein [Acidobacteriota bacterium]